MMGIPFIEVPSSSQLLRNKEASAVYIKQSLVCFRTTDIHAYFTRPVIQVGLQAFPDWVRNFGWRTLMATNLITACRLLD